MLLGPTECLCLQMYCICIYDSVGRMYFYVAAHIEKQQIIKGNNHRYNIQCEWTLMAVPLCEE